MTIPQSARALASAGLPGHGTALPAHSAEERVLIEPADGGHGLPGLPSGAGWAVGRCLAGPVSRLVIRVRVAHAMCASLCCTRRS
ncbi:hypothetical protein [Streptomyces albicerus]|jgi:hypothetical protein|uniref:hypothetical protein n=1 Tax=Streptomyces albicerus TaxID=2569859 RepID=UPI00124BA419|nr:hypothetical protein [Streptomyces albicerus]